MGLKNLGKSEGIRSRKILSNKEWARESEITEFEVYLEASEPV
jgi:hypothetical protein